ncbi:DUF4129 domain-containing protein [Mycobacterium montefiorense]|uniref:Protein-glutamine gamma-glutamyltransferase-like C-terminal domain-containing protein n=1 Tax=Mycobacterium montefiorense TaxID=154654 RepID=A0AA37PRE8_9MYCO|nr:DUF4129 domain-containing protein [Mycobacterium montefiorense]GBG36670.1 hypothetical protein MmonteBS_10420 [Mycobacterium montefiorense]GKU37020.1 hypothetical protein NJB14191_43660 [Mycobacterium montefiorense]GKU43075.1 hypothetical protein NJB14192_50580 [Mycobacterium montefiorense]GKU48614.1 hypothetical protein NJB14194_52290 [Mycobacterium montefiorense]GKU50644.1 hypothetical protein NJB14195_18900 [Mycobacterium montefiorense]
MPDKPTGRVVALIVLLIVVAAALRGYLPARDHATRAESGGGRAALVFVVVLLSASLAMLAVAVIARLRDPRAVAPKTADLSEMLGTGGGRPSWRVLLIGLAVIVAWLLIAMLLARLSLHYGAPPADHAPGAGTQPHTAAPSPQHRPPHDDNGNMLGILLATTVPMMLILVAGTLIMSRRRLAATTLHTLTDDVDYRPPVRQSESLVRAAEVGLAEMSDRTREPREAIIACYAAMERELANVPGAAPQEFDTPTEVLARAVERHALHIDNAIQLVNLFEEARFSPHVMNEGHRDIAVDVLRLVLAELRSPV